MFIGVLICRGSNIEGVCASVHGRRWLWSGWPSPVRGLEVSPEKFLETKCPKRPYVRFDACETPRDQCDQGSVTVCLCVQDCKTACTAVTIKILCHLD